MALKKGDILDERKRYPDSCGLVVKIMGGGEGFQKIVCCGHELTEEDVVPQLGSPAGRRRGELPLAVILDERKLHPNSCGLRVMVMDGGAGFQKVVCCGHSLTVTSVQDLKFGQLRGTPPGQTGLPGAPGPQGTA
jgi:hypothetical protein